MSIPKISVVLSVKNEINNINQVLVSLKHQSYKPSEIIIVDGGSWDGTWEYLQTQKQIISFELIESNRAQARNFGISKANNDLIAITDAGCIATSKWIENLVKCKITQKADVIAGYYTANPKNVFEKSLIPYVLVMPDKVKHINFLPAARSMLISKQAWIKNGKFPEEYWHNEDYVFSRRLINNNLLVAFCRKAIVEWIPRKNLFSSINMFFRFALGDAESRIFRGKVVLIYTRYFLGVILIYLHQTNLLISLLFIYILWAIKKNYRYVKHVGSFFWLPILQITSDISVMCGTLLGLTLPRNFLLKYLIK